MTRRIKIRMLKDITPPGWTSTFYVDTSRFEYDAVNPRVKKTHQLIFQRGRNYGAVGDMCAGFTHDELLQLERDGFVEIQHVNGASKATDLTVEQCLKELRKLVGSYPQIIVDIRDCGQETRSQHGRVEFCAQIGVNGEQYTAPTMAKVLAQVRDWKESQDKESK